MSIDSNTYKVLNRFTGKALHHYDMISDGDRIIVGLSGGKDSLTLMWILKERLARIPVNYDLFAVYIDPGFKGGFARTLEKYCEESGYKLSPPFLNLCLKRLIELHYMVL